MIIPDTIVPSVLAFLGQAYPTATLSAQAEEVVAVISHLANDYTRGNGIDPTTGPNDGITRVIISASARLLANPDQIEFQTGTVAIRSAFDGWTPLEKTILNSYRKVASA